jgi:CDP-diacylglycerol--serine O-phosphatidyltransferase
MASSSSNSGVSSAGDGGQFAISPGPLVRMLTGSLPGQEKQKMLLSSEHGHFSLVKSVFRIFFAAT